MLRRLLAVFLSGCLLAASSAFARAQTGAYAEVVSVDAQNFPQVSAQLNVFNTNGGFESNLTASDLTVYEDGQPLPVDTLTQLDIPAQIVAAVNPAPALDKRDSNGVARFARVVEALGAWANVQSADANDDLSLVSLSGVLISHASAQDWFVSLSAFKPDFRKSTSNLQTLSIALDTVTMPPRQAGMKRAILFITPHLDDPNIDNAIAPFIQRAVESKTSVFVWFVDAPDQFVSASANAFKSLALQTNGSFVAFSGVETLPDLEEYFAPLRRGYSLTYASAAKVSGEHTIGVSIKTAQGEISAPEKTFSVNVQPPNPIFVSPPLQIARKPPADDPYNADVLVPAQAILRIIVEFPDGHPRDIVRTTLYMDGVKTAENIKAPFDTFIWDLSAYQEGGRFLLTVEAEDSLGLRKTSMETPVTVTVTHPPRNLQALYARYGAYLTTGALALVGLIVIGALLWSVRGGLTRKKRGASKRAAYDDPLTQPVAALSDTTDSTAKRMIMSRLPVFKWQNQPLADDSAPARLVRLTNSGEPASAAPIPILEKETTFGSDPVQSLRVLDDATISPLHARIRLSEDGTYAIYDYGSIAGTWVNYDPVSREGRRLTHGDQIHFGGLVYRFELRQAPLAQTPKVSNNL